MNTLQLPVHRVAQVWFCLALTPLALGTAFAANPAPSATAPAAAPKTHVLFMGADIALDQDRQIHPVADVTANALVIKPGGQRVEVPITRGLNLLINESLKLAGTSVGVADLKAERAYTLGADPFQQLVTSANLAAGQSAPADRSQGEVLRANQGVAASNQVLEAVRGTPNEGMGRAAVAESLAVENQAVESLTQTYNTPGGEIYDVGSQSVKAGVEGSREMFDAIRLSFEVTSEKDLALPYYAVIALIRDHDSKPGQVRKWAYVRSLGPMSAGVPKLVRVFQSGLPPGYILEGCEVHLYNRGEEVATNLSRKRVPLTDDEALEYRIIEYIGANKGRTLPAAPATTALANEVRTSLTADQLTGTCYVRVAKNGRVAAAFRDAAGKQPLQDPGLESALQTLRFKPALEAGKPVESIVAFSFVQFAPP